MNARPIIANDLTGPVPDRRAVIAMIAAAGLAAPLRAGAAPTTYHVSQDGAPGSVRTLAEALARIRGDARPRATILLGRGVFREKLTIDVPGVTIIGRGRDSVIDFDAGAALPKPGGGTWGTSGSATLTIAAPDVTLRDLMVRNSHDYPANRMQAVALAVGASAPRTVIERCAIEGWQDTLLLQATTLIRASRIAGRVDFVFGGAAAWIARCEIVSRNDAAMPGGFIAAPSTPAAQPVGLVFADCRLTREAGVPDGATWLGRPWRAGGNMALLGAATYLRCWMDAHVARDGWTAMGYRAPDGTPRMLGPDEARLYEYGSTGPGAGGAAPTRRALGDDAALQLTPVSTLGGWAADTTRPAPARGGLSL